MNQPRDPRTDQSKGDVLAKNHLWRKVEYVGGTAVFYRDVATGRARMTTPEAWKKWAAKAAVIEVAGSPGPVTPRS